MTDPPIALDRHRGMAAQKATEIRRLLAEVEANEKTLRDRQEELERQLIAAPAATWPEAAEKARYLLILLASTAIARDSALPRRPSAFEWQRAVVHVGGQKLLQRVPHDPRGGHVVSGRKVLHLLVKIGRDDYRGPDCLVLIHRHDRSRITTMRHR
jgi:hypothetical protein